jgi:translocation and assembly module TamB
MKRWVLIVSSLFLALVGLFSWGVYRFFWTTQGVRWLIGAASSFSSVHIAVEKIDGRIAGLLQLEGLEITWPDGKIRIGRMETILVPGGLLHGRIVFQKITLDRISLEDKRARTGPISLTLPKLSRFLTGVDLEIHSFLLENIHYRRLPEEPVDISKIACRLLWRQRILAVNPFSLEMNQGQVRGNLGMGFSPPMIRLNLQLIPANPPGGVNLITVQGNLKSRWRAEFLTGRTTIKGRLRSGQQIFLQTDLGMDPHRITFRNVEIQETERKGSISGKGEVTFEKFGPNFRALFNFNGLDLSNEIKSINSLMGHFSLEGNSKGYKGRFDLKNTSRSWQDFNLSGDLNGTRTGLDMRLVNSQWLKGVLEGRITVNWEKALSIQGLIQGRQLRTEVLLPQRPGLINLNVRGEFIQDRKGQKQGNLDVDLLESRFMDEPLQGEIKTRWDKNLLSIKKADFRGRGFKFQAQGILSERLNFEAVVSHLSYFLPECRGFVSTQGWARWQGERAGGQLAFEGKDISWTGIEIGRLHLQAALDRKKSGTAIGLETRMDKIAYQSFVADVLRAKIKGSLSHQNITLSAQNGPSKVQAALAGSYEAKSWKGRLDSVFGNTIAGGAFKLQAPAALQIALDRFQLSPCRLTGQKGEWLELEADLGWKPVIGSLKAEWQRIDLSRGWSFWKKVLPAGRTTGMVSAQFTGQDRLNLRTRAEMTGSLKVADREIKIKGFKFQTDWNDLGLLSSWELETVTGFRVSGQALSPEKGHLGYPERGTLKAAWEGLDLQFLKPERFSQLQTGGKIKGQVDGDWSPGARFSLQGRLLVEGGYLSWKEKGAVVRTLFQKIEGEMHWSENSLEGDVVLDLDKTNKLSGNFLLPLPARFPLAMQPSGPLKLELRGNVPENGLLGVLYPEVIQSSQGLFQVNLSARGTWEKPSLEGNLGLSQAGADLKPLGIRLQDVSAKAVISKNRLEITSLEMRSGAGKLNGQAIFWLKDWKIVKLRGSLVGTRFLFIQQADLEAQGSPRFDFSGQINGEGTSRSPFTFQGGLQVNGGSLAWKGKDAEVQAHFKKSQAEIFWSGNSLHGDILLEMEKYGKVAGNFRLPFPARFPLTMMPGGPLKIQLQGSLRERGLLGILFPEAIQSSQGVLQLNLGAGGTWEKPSLEGNFELSHAGADLRPLGIHLQNVSAKGVFRNDRVELTSLEMQSGTGKLKGQAIFWLKDWKITELQGRLTGDHFQFVNRPGLEAQGSPKLDFSGSPNRMIVKGVLEIPEALYSSGRPQGFRQANPDVVMVDTLKSSPAKTVFPIQGEIRLLLGQTVKLKEEGLDGTLQGSLKVQIHNSRDIKAFGEIRVIHGFYLLQGQKLQITGGHFSFNGPPDNPGLDMLALRTIRGQQGLESMVNEVKAGIVVTGTLQDPLIRLYSQPPLSDTDILSYILFGQASNQGANNQNVALLGRAAQLLFGGKVPGKLASQLDLDTLEIQSGINDLSQSFVTIGKYLNPNLFLGLGGSIFTNSYQVILRYSLTRHIEVETKGGTSSGGGIYYKIDFE